MFAARACQPKAIGRVFAMARPGRSALEVEVVRLAALERGLTGSVRRRAGELATAVAGIALEDFRATGDDVSSNLALALARAESPALHRLATDPAFDVAAIVRAEAMRQFEARGGRHLPLAEWRNSDDSLRAAIAARLVERLRKGLK